MKVRNSRKTAHCYIWSTSRSRWITFKRQFPSRWIIRASNAHLEHQAALARHAAQVAACCRLIGFISPDGCALGPIFLHSPRSDSRLALILHSPTSTTRRSMARGRAQRDLGHGAAVSLIQLFQLVNDAVAGTEPSRPVPRPARPVTWAASRMAASTKPPSDDLP